MLAWRMKRRFLAEQNQDWDVGNMLRMSVYSSFLLDCCRCSCQSEAFYAEFHGRRNRGTRKQRTLEVIILLLGADYLTFGYPAVGYPKAGHPVPTEDANCQQRHHR